MWGGERRELPDQARGYKSKLRAKRSTEGVATTREAFARYKSVIERSGVVDILEPLLKSSHGPKRRLTVMVYFVASQINASRCTTSELTNVGDVINGFTEEQRLALNIANWNRSESHKHVGRMLGAITKVLTSGLSISYLDQTTELNAVFLSNLMVQASQPRKERRSRARSIDGTAWETWGALHQDPDSIEIDGDIPARFDTPKKLLEAVEEAKMELEEYADSDGLGGPFSNKSTPKRSIKFRKGDGPSFEVDENGRKIYTPDPDARASYRTATSRQRGSKYTGYELHLATQVPGVKWTNYVNKITFGDPVPSVITAFVLCPGGSSRSKAAIDLVDIEAFYGHIIEEIMVDPGYSLATIEDFFKPMWVRGINVTYLPSTYQRGKHPGPDGMLMLDNGLFSNHTPEHLLGDWVKTSGQGKKQMLPTAPRGATVDEKLKFETTFNERASMRMRANGEGRTRYVCPYCAGAVYDKENAKHKRHTTKAKLFALRPEATRCCDGVQRVDTEYACVQQMISAFTTAHRMAMGRRSVVESSNAGLKNNYSKLDYKYARVFGLAKRTLILAFLIVAYNLEVIRSFDSKMEQAEAREEKTRLARTLAIESGISFAEIPDDVSEDSDGASDNDLAADP